MSSINSIRSLLFPILLATFLLSSTSPLRAQAPELLLENTYGGEFWEKGYGGVPTDNGDFVIVGYTESFGAGETDIYLVRVDRFGDTLWTRTYGGPGFEEGYAIAQVAEDRGFILAGTATPAEDAPGNAWLLRTDRNGDTLWTYTWENAGKHYVPTGLRETPDGNFVVIGNVFSPDFTFSTGWISMVDHDGTLLWSKIYTTPYRSGFAGVDTTSSGLVVAGYISNGFEEDIDAWLLEMTGNGDTIRTQKFGGDNGDAFSAVRWNEAKNAYACIGTTNSLGAGETDMLFLELKLSPVQDTMRMRTYGGPGRDFGAALTVTPDGGYTLAGTTETSGLGNLDIWVVRTDGEGEIQWTAQQGGEEGEEAAGIFNAEDGGYWIVGSTESFGSGPSDAWLLRLAADPVSGTPDQEPTAGGPLVEDPAPNPFARTTAIRCRIDQASMVEIAVQDILGRPVRTLLSQHLTPGSYSVEWNGTDGDSRPMPEGTYFCTLHVNGQPYSSKKIMLTR